MTIEDFAEFAVDFTETYINDILKIRTVDVTIGKRDAKNKQEITVKGAGPLSTTLSIYLTDKSAQLTEENLASTIQERLLRARELCSVCGEEASYEISSARLRPWICDAEICSQMRDKFGVGIDPIQELIHNPEMVHLLLLLGYLNKDQQTSQICNGLLNSIAFPRWPIKGLEIPRIEGPHRMQFRKIIGACQTYFCYRGLTEVNTVIMHSFEVIDFNATHLAEFNRDAAIHGIVTAYHGSNSRTWLDILNGGLRNMSGTKEQVNGAAYGPGIYLAQAISLAHSYAHAPAKNGISVTMIAECEVVDKEEYKRKWCNGPSMIYVVPKNEHVRVTRLLVNPVY